MIVRESKKEKNCNFGQGTVTLPGNDIVIADGEGNLIDQPGIMGGFNSSVQKYQEYRSVRSGVRWNDG